MLLLLPEFPCSFELSITLFENILIKAVQFIGRNDVTNGTMQPDGVVVMLNAPFNNPSGIVKGKRDVETDAFVLDGLVKPLHFAIGLRIQW